ncbi:putative cation efflux family protein family [Phaeomoniella chlamydospora]|uniref:Zinc transporter n=1 Tax=Phaeomoniella chlamydospora TaxID=158046 RepID=A0A0G2EA24_PHACM|nr:putative cation efflux family protein family [Phaeomoniella chlamydospora]
MSVDSSGTKSGKSEEGSASPFNFQTTTLAKSPVVKSVRTPIGPPPKGACSPVNKRVANLKPEQNIGQRRGHKYKHSSVSHQIFQEPPVRAPQTLPNSLPIPTFAECRGSMSKEQKTRFYWCLCHMFVAAYILWSAHGSLAMTALSHLLFYDSLGALLCVVVDVLSNFEVWKRSSLRHPFGLERVEVLAGFAMSVLLAFMGADLLSHNFKHATEGMGHESHRAHAHDRVSPGAIDLTVLLAIGSTLVSAIGLKNHARIGKATRFGAFESLPSVLSNPSHFLTLSCSTLLLLLPLLSLKMYSWMDKALSCSMAIAMIILGFRLVKALGSMLLMSYSGSGVQDVILDIENDPSVSRVEDAKFWQVHYGLCMANLKLRANGTEENLLRLRERISSLVRNRLAGGYGTGNGQKWEVTVQFVPEDN